MNLPRRFLPFAPLLALCFATALAAQDPPAGKKSRAAPATEPAAAPAAAPSAGDAAPPAKDAAPAAPAPAPAPPPSAAPAAPRPAADTAGKDREHVNLEDVRRFVSVFRAVKQAYVDPIDDERLMRAAIRGLLTDLDPHSAYLDRDASQQLTEQATGAYDGLGLEVLQQPDRTLLVIAPIDETPAARAGIKPGDIITRIDGVAIDADSVDSAVESMRGAPGTPITLTVERENAPEPLTFTLTRETIRVSSVKVRALDPGYAYLRISNFQADTGAEVNRKLKALQSEVKRPLEGLVLDLRSNPGGLLNSAVEVADAFLEEGLIVSTRGRLGYANSEYRARRGDLLAGAPIVILADSGTASAAEVLAGALRDHRRALVMGSGSFGKGSVQTVLPMDNGDSIKLTTARYYTPSGTSIQAAGIEPDVLLPENAELAQTQDRPPSLRERDLPRHLQGDNENAAAAPAGERAEELEDFAVREAQNLLKGLSVFRQKGAPAKPAAPKKG